MDGAGDVQFFQRRGGADADQGGGLGAVGIEIDVFLYGRIGSEGIQGINGQIAVGIGAEFGAGVAIGAHLGIEPESGIGRFDDG